MNDERIPNIDPGSWAYEILIGQPRDWTPRARIRNVTATANINPLDGIIRADATSAAITLTLETAVGCDGRLHHIKKIDSSANAITIDGNGSETIDGASSYSLSSQYDHVLLISNGTNWDVVSETGSGSGGGGGSGSFGQVLLTKSGTNLQLAAYKGNQLTFADGTVATISSALTLAPTSLSASTNYYIYATKSGTTVNAIEASTTSYATTDGIRHMTGNTAKALVGFARTNGSTAWVDDREQRFVRSWFNDQGVSLFSDVIASALTAVSAGYAEKDPTTHTGRIEWLAWANEPIHLSHCGVHYNTTAGGGVVSAIGVDSASDAAGANGISIFASNVSATASENHSFTVTYHTTLGETNHFACGLIRAFTSNSAQSQGAVMATTNGAP